MRNFAGKNRPDKKVWGVLGKQETFYSPEQFQDKGRIIPLNANPLEAWDSTRSRYIRRPQMPPLANDGQQAGVIPQVSSGPVPSPTPTITSTVTPTTTQTSTPTPSITPSSTPYPLPIQPVLWYDSTNLGSIDYISSGGTNYISAWRSLGTIQKTLSGDSVNTMPIWSGSSQLPGSPLIVRFDKNTNTALQDYLTQRFDSTPIPYSGLTVFQVFAKPNGLTYQDTSTTLGFGYPFVLVSGNTTNGGFTSGTTPIFLVNISVNQAGQTNSIINQKREFAYVNNTTITNFSAATINNKFLYHVAMPYPTGSTYFEINQSGGTNTISPITASTSNTSFNQIYLGRQFGTSGGTLSTANNAGGELGEIMVFNRELTIQEQEQVQNYLRDKWRYDEWASPVPTPTPTYTPTSTATPTPTVTQTQTSTTTQTPSPTPSGAPASGTTEALIYLNRVIQSGGTVDATASAATITLFTSLVSNGLWDKIDAFYPTLGGVAASHTINGKSGTGTVYDLTFNGGWTHSSSGMQPNGTNGYAETGFNPNTLIGNGNTSHLSVYVNLQGTVGDRIYDMGVATDPGSLTDMWNIAAKRTSGTGNNTLFDAGTYSGGRVDTTSQASASGMTVGSVRSTTDRTLYRNGSNIATSSTSQSITYANRTIVIGGQKGTAPVDFYSSNQYAFATMGRGLTNTEIVNLSSIINTYQTSLGRNTY